jgi:hypothetical protein
MITVQPGNGLISQLKQPVKAHMKLAATGVRWGRNLEQPSKQKNQEHPAVLRRKRREILFPGD